MVESSGRSQRLGQVALKLGLITQEQLDELLGLQKQMKASGLSMQIGDMMLQKGYLTPDQLAKVLKAAGMPVQTIPGYQILARIGEGGMGTVYRARHIGTQREVALKTLSGQFTQKGSYVERFLREARTAAKLRHKNVVQVFDAGFTTGVYYLAMEYVTGPSVHDLVAKSGRLPEKKALEITRQVADALGAISKLGMVHRDVKPDNIMITADGQAKLCDFGLAKAPATEKNITQAGTVVGTPQYMSPEQIEGRKLDIRSDL
jgi:serine/threonine-protein kinase